MSWDWEAKDAIILPYVDGQHSYIPEDFLPNLYLQLRKDRTINIMFPGIEEEKLTMAFFVGYMKDIPLIVGLMKPSYDIAGVGWLWGAEGQPGYRKASIGFGFFKKYWGKSEIRTIARMTLDWWFSQIRVDVLYGPTLTTNLRAQGFAKELGFERVAELPLFFSRKQKLVGATMMMLTREQYQERSQWVVEPVELKQVKTL